MAALLTPEALVALLTLTALEVVLGIDNVVFISILCSRLPAEAAQKLRRLGLSLALFLRIGLLFAISWVMGLTATLFQVMGHDISGKSLILLVGGLFLVAKATHEIHDKLEVEHEHETSVRPAANFTLLLIQVLLLDLVFSLDSVITAVGMAQQVPIMVAAMVIAVGVMLVFAGAISSFVNRHPTMKILALSFLLLIGVMLMAEGLGQHISKGYIYFAMAFSLLVELLNLRMRQRSRPVVLHHRFEGENQKI